MSDAKTPAGTAVDKTSKMSPTTVRRRGQENALDAVPPAKPITNSSTADPQIAEDTLDETYQRVVNRIGDGTVTRHDINALIAEATPKSTKERTMRHSRVDGPEPSEYSPVGSTVPKREGRNDPPSQGRGRRYASGTAAKERQNEQQRRDKEGTDSRLREAAMFLLSGKQLSEYRGDYGSLRRVLSETLRRGTPILERVVGAAGGKSRPSDDTLYKMLVEIDTGTSSWAPA